MENLWSNIRELRKERGITSNEMATRLGISRNTLTDWERGRKKPHGIMILEEMAKILEVPLKKLLAGENEEQIENNPAIRSLNERVTRLEQVCKKFLK